MGDGPAECNIKVICRVRPLNESEERAGSKFVLKFPTDDSLSIQASWLLIWKFILSYICDYVQRTYGHIITKCLFQGIEPKRIEVDCLLQVMCIIS